MSDQLRRELARAAGDGDISAARRLVIVLEREALARDWPLSPDVKLGDLPEDDFGGSKKSGMKVRVLTVVYRAVRIDLHERFGPESGQLVRALDEFTLRDVASMTLQELARARDCGPKVLATIDALLARAGLTLKNDPTQRLVIRERSLPSGLLDRTRSSEKPSP